MENFVITFARGFGTGGKAIASQLAKELGIHCYENRILTLASQLSGLDENIFQEVNEKMRETSGFSSFLRGLPRSRRYISRNEKFVSDDKLFEYQSEIIKDLAEKEVEDAARLLGEMRRGCQQAEEQLKMLIDYQNEYRNNLNSDMSAGMTSNRWINYQQFIQTLEKAITQHRQQLNQWTQKVDIALNSWREKKQRLQAWQTLQERQSTAALLAENRLDQKKMDEFAQRAAMRKPE